MSEPEYSAEAPPATNPRGDGRSLRSTLTGQRILLALLCLLTLATSASAECAWVLWAFYHDGGEAKSLGVPVEVWSPLMARETMADCRAFATEMNKNAYQQADGTPSRLAKCLPVGVQP